MALAQGLHSASCYNYKDVETVCKTHLYCAECGIYNSYYDDQDSFHKLLLFCDICNKEDKVYCERCYNFHFEKNHTMEHWNERCKLGMYDDQHVFTKTCKPYRLYAKG